MLKDLQATGEPQAFGRKAKVRQGSPRQTSASIRKLSVMEPNMDWHYDPPRQKYWRFDEQKHQYIFSDGQVIPQPGSVAMPSVLS